MYSDEKYSRSVSGAEPNTISEGRVLNSFINRVFGWMFAGLAATGAISWYLGTYQAEKVMQYLGALRGCEVHSSVILSAVDEKTFKRLGVNLTCQARFKG